MIEFARWATNKEIDDFYKWCKKKNDNNDFFTSDWLVKNGNNFIFLHQKYPDDIVKIKISEVNEYNENQKQAYRKQLDIFNSRLNSKCICGGNNVLLNGYNDAYQFIGCDNYREQGFEHTKIYFPRLWQKDIEQELTWLEIRTNYLNNLKKINNLPSELKESVLCQYLLMNNQTLYADLESRFNLTRDVKIKSNSREKIIEKILIPKFEKVFYQKGIMVKMIGQKPKLKFPDFICINDSGCYIFEQKKTIDHINLSQAIEYQRILQHMIFKSKKDILVYNCFVIEEGVTDENNLIFNLKSLQEYEFN
jgi:ssDNA-binding Zn-finger/Zn-ribbon topoisomerase 1